MDIANEHSVRAAIERTVAAYGDLDFAPLPGVVAFGRHRAVAARDYRDLVAWS